MSSRVRFWLASGSSQLTRVDAILLTRVRGQKNRSKNLKKKFLSLSLSLSFKFRPLLTSTVFGYQLQLFSKKNFSNFFVPVGWNPAVTIIRPPIRIFSYVVCVCLSQPLKSFEPALGFSRNLVSSVFRAFKPQIQIFKKIRVYLLPFAYVFL